VDGAILPTPLLIPSFHDVKYGNVNKLGMNNSDVTVTDAVWKKFP
jgi:hypothetical protein